MFLNFKFDQIVTISLAIISIFRFFFIISFFDSKFVFVFSFSFFSSFDSFFLKKKKTTNLKN